MRNAFFSKRGHSVVSRENTNQERWQRSQRLSNAIKPCLEMLEDRRLLSTVSIPSDLIVRPGDTVQIPVAIDDAADLMAVDLKITYDTNQLDLGNADIARGSLLPASWGAAFNSNDAAGTVALTAYTMGLPMTGGSGNLFVLTFHVPNNAPVGESQFKLTSSLNESPEPATTVSSLVVLGEETVVAKGDAYEVNEDATLTIAAPGVLANDKDLDGNALSAAVLTNPSHGTLTLNADGSFSYVPAANFSGTDSFTYKATTTSSMSLATKVTIVVKPVNDAPTAGDNVVSVTEGNSVQIDLRTLVSDHETATANLVFSEVALADAASGTLTEVSTGVYSFTPAAGFSGNASLTYKVTDNGDPAGSNTGALSDVGAVTITVVAGNDAPEAVDDAYTTQEDTSVTGNVLTNDTDPDGDELTVVNGPLFLNADGSFTYTPAPDFRGVRTWEYTVSDGFGNTSTAMLTITVEPVADAPVAFDDAYSTEAGETLTVAAPGVLENDNDVDGDTLTVALVNGPAHGELNLNADGSFTYTPAAGFSGTDSFTYKANDGSLDSAAATVTLTVNAEPVIGAHVSIPLGLMVQKGESIEVPVTIDNATGLMAADLIISYDTNLFDLTNADVTQGGLLPGNWQTVANVDDAAGTVRLSAFTMGQALAGGAGELIKLVFHTTANALLGETTLGISGKLNDGDLPMTPVNGSVRIVGEPVAPVNVALPASLKTQAGQTIHVPVTIDNATGLMAADLTITYDTTLFDLTNEDVLAGNLLPASWTVIPNVNDALGTISLSAFASDLGLTGGSGALLDLVFHVAADAPAGTSAITLSGSLNEGNLPMNAANGSITIEAVSPVLTIDGTTDQDVIALSMGEIEVVSQGAALASTTGPVLIVMINGSTTSYSLAGITSIVINGLGGNDKFLIDATNGMPAVSGGIQINGGAGFDELDVNSDKDMIVVGNESQLSFDGVVVTFAEVEDTGWDIGNGSSLTLNGSVAVLLDEPMQLASLTLAGSAKLILAQGGTTMLTLGALNIGPNATLDLADNSLIVRSTLLERQGEYDTLVEAIKSARGTGKWLGAGLTSSVAQAKAAAKQAFTGLAIVLNDKGNGKPMFSTFGGQSVGVNDILVKYTWNGDVNLDGKIDAADYFRVDCGYISEFGYYAHGDLNFDGLVDAGDYFLIDSAYIAQHGTTAAQTAPEAEDVLVLKAAPAQKDAAPSVLQQLFSTNPVL